MFEVAVVVVVVVVGGVVVAVGVNEGAKMIWGPCDHCGREEWLVKWPWSGSWLCTDCTNTGVDIADEVAEDMLKMKGE